MAPSTIDTPSEVNLQTHRADRDQIHRIQSPLTISDFTSLAEHQSQTPSSFYYGPPVLHHICRNASLRLSTRDTSSIPYFTDYVQQPTTQTAHDEGASTAESVVEVRGIEVWITSENLKIAFPEHGPEPGYVTIPYPLIVLHANQPASATAPGCLHLQIRAIGESSCNDEDDDDDNDPYHTITLSIVPPDVPAYPPPSPPLVADTAAAGEVQKMFEALTNCSNLYPDRGDDDDEDETMDMDGAGPGWSAGSHHQPDLPPPVPGSGGWITADNAAEYFDADGNFRPHVGINNNTTSTTTTNGNGSHQATTTDLPPPIPGSGGWITADNVDDFFDEEGNVRGRLGLGVGAGRVRGREEEGGLGEEGGQGDEGEEEGDGGDGEEEGETKWRRTG